MLIYKRLMESAERSFLLHSLMAQFSFPGQTNFYRGKVRDVYTIGEDLLIMIASDRISAFDVVLPEPIPHKGQVLNQLAGYMLQQCREVCSNWLLALPAPAAAIGKRCDPFKVEFVVRGNLAGHAWRTYSAGTRKLCGVLMPEGMKENDFFPQPILTPSTKAMEGHDEDIDKDEIIAAGLMTEYEWLTTEKYALSLFEKGRQLANERNLILADTKYEFGKIGEEIVLMDEIHTPDSSRYFYKEGFEDRLLRGEKQKQLSKEFVREWLMDNGFMGKAGQNVPPMSAAVVSNISARYIELYERITGKQFLPESLSPEEIFSRVSGSIAALRYV